MLFTLIGGEKNAMLNLRPIRLYSVLHSVRIDGGLSTYSRIKPSIYRCIPSNPAIFYLEIGFTPFKF